MRMKISRMATAGLLSVSIMVGAAQPASAVTIVDPNNPYGADFINNDGQWTIWKGCFSYINGLGQLTTIGPGYIGRLTWNGRVLLNDEAGPPGGLNSIPPRGGLGTFGIHYARGRPDPNPGPYALESSPFTTDLDGRTCSNGSSKGVYRVDVRQGPYVSGGVGVLDLTVWIRDQFGRTHRGPDSDGDGIGDAGIRLDYDTRVYDSVIKQWASVTTYFQYNWEGHAFVKEPKFTASAPNSQAGWKRIAAFTDDGWQNVRTYTGNGPKAANHNDLDRRIRVRYDYGTDTTAASPCGTNYPCLNILFRATPPSGGWAYWENGNSGLDGWAVRSHHEARLPVHDIDQANNNPQNGLPYSWACNSEYYPPTPFAQGVRRWEFIGTSAGNYQPFSNVTTLATGWEGGRGAFDCEPLSREFRADESYTVEMNYSINDGWQV